MLLSLNKKAKEIYPTSNPKTMQEQQSFRVKWKLTSMHLRSLIRVNVFCVLKIGSFYVIVLYLSPLCYDCHSFRCVGSSHSVKKIHASF